MARISNCKLHEQPAHYTVSVRKKINFFAEYSSFMDEALAKIEPIMKENGAFSCGGPFTCFYNTDLEALDVEVGYDAAKELAAPPEIRVRSVPARLVADAIDLGPYEQQDQTMFDIIEFIKASGKTLTGEIVYYYLNEPDRPAEQYLTHMMMPLK